MNLGLWLDDHLSSLLCEQAWPPQALLTGEQARLRVVSVAVVEQGTDREYRAVWELRLEDKAGKISDVKQSIIWLGDLPAEVAQLAVPADIEAVSARWCGAVEQAAARCWRTAEYPETISVPDLLSGISGLVDVITAHAQHGPASPRPLALAPRHAPLGLTVVEPGVAPTATFFVHPDTIELHFLDFLALQIIVRTPSGQAVMLRRDGMVEIIDGQVESVRAVLSWLAESARALGDPIAHVTDPEAEDEDAEVLHYILSVLFDQLASTATLDWRIEPDHLAEAGVLPDKPGHRHAWAGFLSRHFQ